MFKKKSFTGLLLTTVLIAALCTPSAAFLAADGDFVEESTDLENATGDETTDAESEDPVSDDTDSGDAGSDDTESDDPSSDEEDPASDDEDYTNYPYFYTDGGAIRVGDTYTLYLFDYDSSIYDDIQWSVEDTSIAEITYIGAPSEDDTSIAEITYIGAPSEDDTLESEYYAEITGLSYGYTTVTATVHIAQEADDEYVYDESYDYSDYGYEDIEDEYYTISFTIYVTDPVLESNESVIVAGSAIKLPFSQYSKLYSTIECSSSDETVARVFVNGKGKVRVKGLELGDATLTVKIDGAEFTYTIHVSDPVLNKTNIVTTKGKSKKLKVTGLNKYSSVSFASSNTSVATISQSGKIQIKKRGRTTLSATVDNASYTCLLEVTSMKARSATVRGYKIMFSSTYSQLYRMKKGYYDCSSLVFRAYKKDTSLFGGDKSYAPTAAAEAYYLNAHGKKLSGHAISVTRLQPGDLIFFGGANNGRYKGIYHVSMYYGNNQRLETDMRYYSKDENIVMICRPT